MPYALVPIALTALLIYGFTFLLSRMGLISQTVHRRFWNTCLLLTFFVTALLGLILAVQANYKLELRIVDTLLTWHVDFGIGMSLIAIFHFSWHWSYYTGMLRRKGPSGGSGFAGAAGEKLALPGKEISWVREISGREYLPFLSLGATAMITQVVLLREYLAVFHGNELVIGVILAGWLLLTGTGARIGKNIPESFYSSNRQPLAFILLGLLPILTVFGIRFFKNIAFPAGSMPGVPGILLYSVASMAFFCLLSGFLFTWLSSWISMRKNANLVNLGYAAESSGSIAAGILFSFLLVFFLDTFQVLFLVLLLNLATAVTCSAKQHRRSLWLVSLSLGLVLLIVTFATDIDRASRSFLFPNQEVIVTRDTPYGNLVVSRSAEQYTLFVNTSPIASNSDVASVEEDVHYAMCQHPEPASVLVFSGDLPGISAELAKYDVRKVDFVEINPWIGRIGSLYIEPPEAPWLTMINMDGRRYLDRTESSYDVVLINLPPPGSVQLNRFYTSEFFAGLKKRMAPGGIVSVPLQAAENYISGEAGGSYAILYHTLKRHFRYILAVPGMKTYFLASDTSLDLDIPRLIETKGIETVYVNGYYLEKDLLEQRNRQLMGIIPDDAGINRDFRPLAFFQQLTYWLSYFKSNFWIGLGIIMALVVLLGFRVGPLNNGIFITGFTGLGAEIAILLGIQVVFGYVYLYTAVILTVFMTGLASGALLVNRIIRSHGTRNFAALQLVLALSVFLLYWWFMLLQRGPLPLELVHSGFLLLLFAVAFVSGLLFARAATLRKGGIATTAGTLYSSDLAGSAAGSVLMAILMIPLLGLANSLLVLVILNFLASLNTLFRHKD